MTRDKAIKVVQQLIRLYLVNQGYHVEHIGQQWQWRDGNSAPKVAEDELAAVLAASNALIRASVGSQTA
jgi:hypothetical protein